MRRKVAISANKTDFIIFFTLGVIGVVLGLGLILLQYFNTGYVIDFSPPNPYSFFVGWALLGVVSIIGGSIAVFRTYKIFIPLKNNNYTTTNPVCPRCGAIVTEYAMVCEKCKQQIDHSTIIR